MWKIPDNQPDEMVQVDRPEIEQDTPHPDVSDPREGANRSIVRRHHPNGLVTSWVLLACSATVVAKRYIHDVIRDHFQLYNKIALSADKIVIDDNAVLG